MEQVAREKRTECVISTSDNFYHWGVWSGAGSEVLHSTKFGPGDCVVADMCSGNPHEPKWQSLFHKDPGGDKHIEGGFALFELGRDAGSFTFYSGDARPLGKGSVKLY